VGGRILIVDDEPDIARYLAMILKANGFTPIVANSAETGFQRMAEQLPDLVCLDIMMPSESGISMYQQLRQNKSTRHIPVIIISGAEQEDRFDFHSYLPEESIPEPECYMEKPVNADKYVETVKSLISSGPAAGRRNQK